MPEAKSRIFTIPNVISLARLACVPWALSMLWEEPPNLWGAGWLLAILGATDWVDGYIARHFNQGSELGKVLDPTADRILLLAGAIGVLHLDLSTPINILLVVILLREFLIAVATVSLAIAGARRIDVVWAGKAGTLAIMFAIPLFLLAEAWDSFSWFVSFAAWCFAIGGIALGYYAAMKYIPAARAALKEGRSAQPGTEVHP